MQRLAFCALGFSFLLMGCNETPAAQQPKTEPLHTPPSYAPDEGWKVSDLDEAERIQACKGLVLYFHADRTLPDGEFTAFRSQGDEVGIEYPSSRTRTGRAFLECQFTADTIRGRMSGGPTATRQASWRDPAYNFALKGKQVAFKKTDQNIRHFPVTVRDQSIDRR